MRSRWERDLTTAAGVVYVCVSVAAGLLGGFLLIFHGYVEDSGSAPANTLPYAVIWFVHAIVLLVIAVFTLMRRQRLFVLLGLGVVLQMLVTFVGLYGFGWEPFPYHQSDNPDLH